MGVVATNSASSPERAQSKVGGRRGQASATWRSRAAVQHDTRGGGQPCMESCTTAQPSGKWKSRKRRAWSLRCERVHGSGSEKGGEGCAIRCDGWQDKVFKCHEIQPSKAHESKGRFARSLLATLSEGEGRQEREGGWRGRRTAVVLSDLQRLSLPHSRLLARSEKEP